MEAKTYTCPECAGNYIQKQHKRIKRWDGDHFEVWESHCWLCDEGKVTLDMILENATEPLEYFERVIESGKPKERPSADVDVDVDVNDIPF